MLAVWDSDSLSTALYAISMSSSGVGGSGASKLDGGQTGALWDGALECRRVCFFSSKRALLAIDSAVAH